MRRTLLVLVVLACVSPGRVNDRAVVHPQTSAAPTIQIEGDAAFARSKALALRCRISNPGSEPLYIYSSVLENPRFAEIVIDRQHKLIELRFTRLEKSPLLPYYFPRAAFREIRPTQSETFSVASTSAVRELTQGRWQLRVVIGFGHEVSAVKLALRSDAEGTEHPINEIVRWQKAAFSNSITIEITK